MHQSARLLALLFLFGFLACSQPARACPFCSDAVPQAAGAEALDQSRESAAYNFSIYLMAGMPFLLLTSGGFWVYRGLKRVAAAEALAAPHRSVRGQSCPLPISRRRSVVSTAAASTSERSRRLRLPRQPARG